METWPDPSSSEDCGGDRGRRLAPESSWHGEAVWGGAGDRVFLVLRLLDQLGDNMGGTNGCHTSQRGRLG